LRLKISCLIQLLLRALSTEHAILSLEVDLRLSLIVDLLVTFLQIVTRQVLLSRHHLIVLSDDGHGLGFPCHFYFRVHDRTDLVIVLHLDVLTMRFGRALHSQSVLFVILLITLFFLGSWRAEAVDKVTVLYLLVVGLKLIDFFKLSLV